MNTTDTRTWLEAQGLAEFTAVFEQNHVTPTMMASLTGDDLRDMGIASVGHRKRLLAAFGTLNAPSEIAPPADPSPKAVLVALPPPSQNGFVMPPQQAGARAPSTQPKAVPWPQPTADVMAEAPPHAPDSDQSKKPKRKGFSPGFLAVSIALHVVLGLGAGYWVVQQINAKRKLQFSGGPPTASPSKRAMEHKVSLQKKKNAGGAPAQARRIAVTGLAASVTLPEMPAMPNSSTQIVAGRMAGMGGAGFGTGMGFGNGSGMGVGGMGGGLGLTMFGMRSSSEVIIVIDISGSMVQGNKDRKSYDELEDEAIKAIRLLGPTTKFNVITFAGDVFSFEKALVASSPTTKDAAIKWLKSYSPCLILPKGVNKGKAEYWKTGQGPRHSGTSSKKALTAAFDMKPGSIIFVTDGEPTDGTPSIILAAVKDMQSKLARKATINTIAYKAGEKVDFLEKLAEQNGGKHKDVE